MFRPDLENEKTALAGGSFGTANSTQQAEVSTAGDAPVKRDTPKPGTVIDAVFHALKHGEKLTPLDAWLRFGTSRLAAVVHTLRGYGWPIESEIVAVSTADQRTAHVACYWMRGAA